MNERAYLVSILAGLVICALATASEPSSESKQSERIIPLADIWGFRMPGTHELRKTEDAEIAQLVQAIQRALPTVGAKTIQAAPGCAVLGTGKEALRAARAVIAEGKKPGETFPAGSDISLVFFSYKFGSYVHFKRVTQRDRDITIEYTIVPHACKEMTCHFALIPLLNCAEGVYRVKVEQLPVDSNSEIGLKRVDDDMSRKVVCGSFSFTCGKQGDKRVSTDKAIEQ
jgi:hypothetical protein